jgi:hypothetical protein
LQTISEEVIVVCCLIIDIASHKGHCEIREFVYSRVEGRTVGLLDWRVVGDKFDEIVYDIGQEDSEEYSGAS